MSSALKALNKSMNKNRPRTLRGRAHMILEVLGYSDKTIKVKAVNGPIAGQEFELDPGNKKVEEFSKPSKAQTSSYTPVGGIIRCESVSAQKDGTYKAGWSNAWIKTPNEDNQLLVDQMVSYRDTGNTNRDDKPIVTIRSMDAKNETKVTNLDEMKAALISAFETTRSAIVFATTDGFESAPYYLPGKRDGDNYVYADPKEFAEKLFSEMDEAELHAFGEELAAGGITVVPVRNIAVGPTTAEEVQKQIDKAAEKGHRARIMSVNPYAYEAPSIGVRLAGALQRTGRDEKLEIPAEYAERLKESFLATAPESAKAAFHADGWKSVADVDLRDFFASKGVELKTHPEVTWNTAAIHLQRFEGGSNFFVAKTFESQRYGQPYPALECCRELRQAYANELVDAIKLVVGAPAVKAEAAAENKAPAGVVDENLPIDQQLDQQADAAASAKSPELDEMDALLDAMAGEQMP